MHMNRQAAERSGPLRVLLVEDHADLAAVTEEMLKNEGLDVQTALSGRQAIDHAAAFLPDLVLCDMRLPDMTGFDVVRALRSNPSTELAYIVVLTAMRERDLAYQSDGGGPGVDAFLSKPITIDGIQALVQTTRAMRTNRNPWTSGQSRDQRHG
jgi:CheY-like chemotaxis protein